jgi:RHS repeat-associated protein
MSVLSRPVFSPRFSMSLSSSVRAGWLLPIMLVLWPSLGTAVEHLHSKVPAPLAVAQEAGGPGLGDADDDDDDDEDDRGTTYTEPHQEYSQRLRSAQEVSALSSDLMGESVNLHDGQTTFNNVDIDVPGTGPAVQLRRRLSITRLGLGEQNFGGFSNWDVDVPYVAATLPTTSAWSGRCSTFFRPAASGDIWLEDFWSGVSVHVPGGIDSELYYLPSSGSSLHPTGDGQTYRWTTSDHSVFRCSGAVGSETFHMITPEGTKYTFDTLVTRQITTLKVHWPTTLGFTTQTRQRAYLLASQVEDRYGNRVEYSYNGNGYPTAIRSYPAGSGSWDRQIQVFYAVVGTETRVASATAHGRTWTYDYGAKGLEYVTPPYDADITTTPKPRWRYQYSGDRVIHSPVWDGTTINCTGAPEDTASYSVTIDHPAGASGTFAFEYHRLARTGVRLDNGCIETRGPGNIPVYKVTIPHFADNFALQTKTISGPGLSSMIWRYAYDAGTPAVGHVQQCAAAACGTQPSERRVKVTEPDQSETWYRFGVKYQENFGRLLGTETWTGGTSSTLLASTSTTYFNGTASPFPDQYGTPSGVNQDVNKLIRPVISRTQTRQAWVFKSSTPTNQFDKFARPLQVVRESGPVGYTVATYSRTENIQYKDKESTLGGAANVWILGRIARRTIPGFSNDAQFNTYHAATLDRDEETRFGKLQRKFGWNADGTLAWVQDGATQQTTLSEYYRGIPGRITYADSTYQQAGINAFGQITSVRNEAGYTTNYDYRSDGRLYQIRYPTAESWNNTTIAFVPTVGGIGAPWRQTVTTGTGRKTVDFDGLWRPLTTLEEDTGIAASKRYVTRRFDHAGREVFVSYPRSSPGTVGTSTSYDALGRPTLIASHNEPGLDPLETEIAYKDGFLTEVTNPRDFVTTTAFQTFDEPSEDAPVSIAEPLGTTTTIIRDVLGKPTSMVRSGDYMYPPGSTVPGDSLMPLSRTTSYVYDNNQRLCKTVEPESGATIVAYDLAGNVDWQATGQTLTSTTTCNNGSPGAMTGIADFAYDVRNRLKDTLYTDASTPDVYRTYTPDGLLNTVISDGSTWTYGYNSRRLPTSEQLALTAPAAGTWSITHGYNLNGHESSLTFPDGSKVEYDPNGLGQPRKVVDPTGGPGGAALNYATGVTYHPNGQLAGFTYGNGIAHTTVQTLVRGLTSTYTDGTIVKDRYVWDDNGNLTSLIDDRAAVLQTRTRSMSYDARDRLLTTTYGYNSRVVTYGYDVLDNLRTTSETLSGRNHRHEYGTDGRLTRIVDPAAPTVSVIGYSYNARGNATSRTSATGFIPNTSSIVSDEANRVRSMTTAGALETFTYDGHGRRTRATTSSGTLMHFYTQAGQALFSENPATPSTLIKSRQYHIYLGNRRIAQKEMDALYYIHNDHLGSLLARTNPAGSLVESTPIWEPWGAPTGIGSSERGLRYAGHYTDFATGLSYMQQRYYDPYAGRFLAVDPVAASPGSFNRYWYANNNPYKYVDPDGRCAKVTGSHICGGGTGAANARMIRFIDDGSNEGGGSGDGENDQPDITECRTAGCTNPALRDAARTVAERASDTADFVDEQAVDAVKYWWAGGFFGKAVRGSGAVFKTTKDALKAAEALGYRKIKETVHGEAVFTNGRNFITRDATGHKKDGAWKVAESIEALGSKNTRSGTWNADLTVRIGD